MSGFWQALHFLRPEWLWALLLAPAVMAWLQLRQRRRDPWRHLVDPHLLPQLLEGGTRRARVSGWLPALGIVLAVLALAGPSWRQEAQPAWQSRSPLVVVLDLSSRILATDLPPTRMLQARSKLATLLAEREGGEVALVVFADDAYTVTPLTSDAANVALFLDELGPEIMPVDGQRPERGIELAASLLRQAGATRGDILLIGDRAGTEAQAVAAHARSLGYRVSALGLGTAQGAAVRERDGSVGQARLDARSLQALAGSGGGRYVQLGAGTADLQTLDLLRPALVGSQQGEGEAGKRWRDEGFWLLPPLMLLSLVAFRRRAGLAMVALACLLPLSLPVQAAEGGWWQRDDQRQHRQLSEGVSAYRRGDFAAAQRQFEGIDTADGWYNLGNALARQGRYDDAIDAYDRALDHQPGMADAVANRAAVEAALKRPQQSPEGQSPPKPGSSKGDGAGNDPAGQQPSPQGSQGQPGGDPQAGKPGQHSPPSPPQAEDATAQQQADQAQREQMEQAMQQSRASTPSQAQANETAEQRERRQATEAWIRRVPDEPGSLLKAKFRIEHERRGREGR